ncbi:MAG: hypothetical protein K9J30_10585 [Bacteroidales bacterium]|nr:hypothetical protein [Bacteroidales bacterium]
MKANRFIVVLLLLAGLGFSSLNGQALVEKNQRWYLLTNDGLYPSVEMMGVFTPSGNVLHKQLFMISTDDSLVPEKGVNKVAFRTHFWYMGVYYEMVSVEGKVYPDGKVFIVFHTNGAGTTTPKNKDH